MQFSSIYQQKGNNFDFIRFFLATLVLYSHSFSIFSGNDTLKESGEFIFTLTSGQVNGGMIAVNMFFLISGFLITISWSNSLDIFHFTIKRILRILPGLTGIFIFVIFIIGPLLSNNLYDYFNQLSLQAIIKDFLGMNISKTTVNNMFSSLPLDAINGSLWTLKYEVYCYIMVLFLGVFKLLNKKVVSALFLLFFTIYLFQTYGDLELTRGIPIPRLFTYFLLGSMFFLYKEYIYFNIKTIIIMIAILYLSSFYELIPISVLFAFSYLLLALIYSPVIKVHNFAKLGDFSYGMYIYAFPVQQVTLYIFKGIEFYSFMFISFFLTLFFASLSWHFIENSSLKLAHSKKIKTFFKERKKLRNKE